MNEQDQQDRLQLEGIISLLEEKLSEGDFAFVDRWLDLTDPSVMPPVCIIGTLSITYWGKDKLTRRAAFLEQAEPFLKEKLGEERAEKLLFRRR